MKKCYTLYLGTLKIECLLSSRKNHKDLLKKKKKNKKIYPWCCHELFGRKKAKLPNTLLVEHYAGRVTLPY